MNSECELYDIELKIKTEEYNDEFVNCRIVLKI